MGDYETSATIIPAGDSLFSRVASILEQARANVVRSVNTNMVLAYWLIGREIVQELQEGEERAAYGKQVLEKLSEQITGRYGAGFSVPNLQNFRKFYLIYSGRIGIQYPPGTNSTGGAERPPKQYLPGREFDSSKLSPAGIELTIIEKSHPPGDISPQGFSPLLSWSHYRALMRVQNDEARAFYEQEAIECGWSKTQLERQIHSSYYHRILANRGKTGLVSATRERLQGEAVPAGHILKSPYVLEFLGLPDSRELHESALEQAIINNLQAFLLEIAKERTLIERALLEVDHETEI